LYNIYIKYKFCFNLKEMKLFNFKKNEDTIEIKIKIQEPDRDGEHDTWRDI